MAGSGDHIHLWPEFAAFTGALGVALVGCER